MQKLMILPEEASFGERADKYLAAQFPQYSRSFLQKLFKAIFADFINQLRTSIFDNLSLS